MIEFKEGYVKIQMSYTLKAFKLMCDKIKLSHRILSRVKATDLTIRDFITMENQLRVMISRLADLQLNYVEVWNEEAKKSEL